MQLISLEELFQEESPSTPFIPLQEFEDMQYNYALEEMFADSLCCVTQTFPYVEGSNIKVKAIMGELT